MEKFNFIITDKKGNLKRISVFLDDKTADILKNCSEEIQRIYLTEEYDARNKDRAETRRHTSYDEMLENGFDIASSEDEPSGKVIRLEENTRLHRALRVLTEKQYKALWLVAVDKLSYHEAGERMGVRWETVREHYEAAIKKLRKFF